MLDAVTRLRKRIVAFRTTRSHLLLNSLDNAASKVSPHMLAFGRQPRSPIDALITTSKESTSSDPPSSEYFQRSLGKKEELIEIARINHESNRRVANRNYDEGKKASDITGGDWVLIKKEQRTDSLDVKFEGPFEVLEQGSSNCGSRVCYPWLSTFVNPMNTETAYQLLTVETTFPQIFLFTY